jgi:pimeloyl-ACP methyl ester carboxylesterase
MKGFRPTYLSNKPISAITSFFREQTLDHFNITRALDTSFTDISTSILIGHSMGGLVARAWEQQNRQQNRNPEIGGIITVATPNLGSIANRAAKDGILPDVMDRATNLLSDPLVGTDISDKVLTLPPALTTSVIVASSLLNAVEGLKNIFNTAISGIIKRRDPYIPCFDDMIPNSNFLDSLNAPNQTGSIPPIINIRCVANFPSFYRVAYSFIPFVGDPHRAATDEYNDSPLVITTDILAASLLAAYTRGLGSIDYILAQGNDTMNAKLIRDPMMIYAIAASRTEYPALRTWRSLKYDIPVTVATLFGSAQIIYLPYSSTMQKIRRTVENGVTDGLPLFRLVQTNEGEFVPVINEGDDGTLAERVQEQLYNKLRTIKVEGVTHVSVQNNRQVRLALDDLFQNQPGFQINRK